MTVSQTYERIYAGKIGHTISLTLKNSDGTPISLSTSGTVVSLKLYKQGSDVAVWTKTCTIDSAPNGLAHYTTASGDLATGEYFSQVLIVDGSGNSRVEVGPSFSILPTAIADNLVTIKELLTFMDIPVESAKNDLAIQTYLDEAQSILELDVPSLSSTTDPKYLRQKKTLIMLGAAILYYMNSDENFVDPNKRIPKVELWTKKYNDMAIKLGQQLSTTGQSPSLARRVYNSCYTDTTSPDYDPNVP